MVISHSWRRRIHNGYSQRHNASLPKADLSPKSTEEIAKETITLFRSWHFVIMGRPMSRQDQARRVLQEMYKVRDLPHVTELSLAAQFPIAHAKMPVVTVLGEWEVREPSRRESTSAQIDSLFLAGLTAARKNELRKHAERILRGLQEANHKGEDDAIEYVYEQLHVLAEAKEFGVIDVILRDTKPDLFPNAVLLSILTFAALGEITVQLRSRETFYARVASLLREREGVDASDDLLAGLE